MKYVIYVLAVLMIASMASADEVLLNGPTDGWSTSAMSIEFAFSFDDSNLDIANCTLYVDGEQKAFRNSLFLYQGNKIKAQMTPGEHDWNIACYTTEGQQLVSTSRSITVTSDMEVKEGYEIVYNNNGLRSYEITPAPGQSPVDLPAMKAGEDIRIRTTDRTYYFDVLKMGTTSNSTFVELRDRLTNKPIRLLSGETYLFAPHEYLEVSIRLNEVIRRVDAKFTIIPFPDGEAPVEQPNNNESQIPPVEENVTVEEPVVQPPVEEPQVPAEEPSTSEPQTPPVIESEPEGSSLNVGMIVLIVVVILSALGIAAYALTRKGGQ